MNIKSIRHRLNNLHKELESVISHYPETDDCDQAMMNANIKMIEAMEYLNDALQNIE